MSLLTNGVAFVAYPENVQKAVQAAAKEWEAFLRLPDEAKDIFAASNPQLSVGYERKGVGLHGSKGESNDFKENFDITPAGIKELRQNTDTSSIEPFLDAVASLLESLEAPVNDFCQKMEEEYDIPGFGDTAKESAMNRFIRFLYYPPAPEGTVIGEAHTDHSGYTLHLHESTGGCHGLSPQTNEWFDMPVSSNQMAVFGGMQLQLVSKGNIKALSHEITANKTTAESGRISMVCFNVLNGVPLYNRAAHGRLQEKTPRFNYHMTHEQFAELFK